MERSAFGRVDELAVAWSEVAVSLGAYESGSVCGTMRLATGPLEWYRLLQWAGFPGLEFLDFVIIRLRKCPRYTA